MIRRAQAVGVAVKRSWRLGEPILEQDGLTDFGPFTRGALEVTVEKVAPKKPLWQTGGFLRKR